MADLTYEPRTVCASCESWETVIIGSKGDEYRVSYNGINPGEYGRNWACQCIGYQMRGKCSHIERAKALACFEGEDAYAGGSGLDPDLKECPKCHGPVFVILVAV